ncbi:MAG: CopM family metallochaperone [Janthinobacterium lividum]
MRLTTITLTTLLLAAPALAQTDPHAGMKMGAAPAADGSMMESMDKMNKAMSSAPMTGEADHDFVVMMLPHHQGAVDMAKYELAHGKDPALLKLSREIVAAQDKEIAFMKSWLAKHPSK